MSNIFMLCEKITEQEVKYLNGEYLANIKYDGERIMAIKKDGDIFLINRRGNIVNDRFEEVVNALKSLPLNIVLDGEIISYNNKFEDLQRRALTKDKAKQKILINQIPCFYMVFDILSWGNEDLKFKPLKERLNFMQEEWFFNPIIKKVEYIPIDICLKKSRDMNGEGIIIKNMQGRYETRRSKNWLKLKFFHEQVLTFITYTKNNAGIRCEDKNGNVVQVAGEQSNKVAELIDKNGSVQLEVQYLTISKEGRMRFPSCRGVVC